MGAAVGGAMGAMIGIWSALQTKKLILLPISILTSGGFFGFIMMCGSIVRSDTNNIYCHLGKPDNSLSSQKEESGVANARQPSFW
jgi:ABC-type transport system involved in multi-copper enzyme maturation permease subunit